MRARAGSEIKRKYAQLAPWLDERGRRLWAAAEAQGLGYGGVSAVAKATGLSRTTITAGLNELRTKPGGRAGPPAAAGMKIRRGGAGRPPLASTDRLLEQALETLIIPSPECGPRPPVWWTGMSTRQLAKELASQGHQVSHAKVAQLLRTKGFNLETNRPSHPGDNLDQRRDQVEYLSRQIADWQKRGQPVIVVRTQRQEHRVDSARSETVGKPEPGAAEVPGPAANRPKLTNGEKVSGLGQGRWVTRGKDFPTIEFTAATVGRWWRMMGRDRFPLAQELLLVIEGGARAGERIRQWRLCLQRLANEMKMILAVGAFPPATSKWTEIEPQVTCQLWQNRQGKPRLRLEVEIELIGGAAAASATAVDPSNHWPIGSAISGRKVPEEKMAPLRVEEAEFRGEWNYRIRPQT